MRALRAWPFVLGALLAGPAAHANPETATPVHAGTQVTPPVTAGEPALPEQMSQREQLDQRRAVRGCSIEEPCARPAEVLREFQLETMPPASGSPWLDDRAVPGSHLEASAPRHVTKPSELRPDAPWLDQLELPDLPVQWTQQLADYLVFYKQDPRGRAIMEGWLIAQSRYRDMIVSHLRAAKLPEDLLYVAMIESSYDPEDSSSAGALGLWQFMPENSLIYGLRRDRWVDERRDPYRSTIAQMDYFQDLYQRFGDWPIAMAAFNAGYGAVLRAVARYNTNDFYQLCSYENGLPWETCWYTPKVLATAIVGHNRALFGYDKLKELPPEKWDDVAVPVSLPLSIIAQAAGASEADIKRLNPQLRHGRTPPGDPGYVVRVPAGAKPEFQRRLADLQTAWGGYDAYVVAHGERFEDVATTFGLSEAALRKLNDVTNEAEIAGGTQLVVPRISEEARAKNRARARAKLMGSGVDQRDGETMIVPVPDKDFVVEGKRRVFYRVVAGDSLKSVSGALGVPRADLAAWNGLAADANLHARMVLQAFVAPAFDADDHHVALLDATNLQVVTRGSAEHLDLAEERTGRARLDYTATGKEKLADVARKFGMGSHDLARINRISYDTVLTKGQTIIVYQVVDHARSKRAEEQWQKTPRARRGKLTGERTAHSASAGDATPPAPTQPPAVTVTPPAHDDDGPVTDPD